MLKSLLIKNYALIESLHIEFESGLNIITGETGAGKSILIDALSLVLGERASADMIRAGAEKAVVEGIFLVGENLRVQKFLQVNEFDRPDELILRREVSIKGSSRSFINDTPVTLVQLKALGDMLIDLHGQHEHQSLLRAETHISLLDDYARLDGLLSEYKISYDKLGLLLRDLHDLQKKEKHLKERAELYKFQLDEIDAIGPKPAEDEALEAEIKILENAEKLFQTTSTVYQSLYEGEHSLYDQLVLVRNQIEDLFEIDKTFEETKKEISAAVAIVSELSKFIQSYNAGIEFNAERLEQIRERIGRLALLKKKYGGSIDSLIAHREKIAHELSLAENFDEEIKKMISAIEEERKRCSAAAERLSIKRREYIGKINEQVSEELAKVGMPRARFEVGIESRELHTPHPHSSFLQFGKQCYEALSTGMDVVEFFLSPNLGEDTKPLARIASGGEISRVMLALKTILAKSDRLPAMVFDEIDVGISGRIAQAVGKSLKNLSQFHQIVAITHLPQIAGLADVHFVVEKRERQKRTETNVKKLSLEDRVREVAKLMSGLEITEAGLEGARELMGLK